MAIDPAENLHSSAAGEIKVQTSRFGEITVQEDKLIIMTSPFLGFPESKRFVLRPHGPSSPFMWLQSVDNPKLAFVVIQPAILIPQYKPEIPGHIKRELQVPDGEQPDLLLILTIPKDKPQEMTANLLGPVAINPAKRLAKQVLLDPVQYDACWPVFVESE